MNMPTGTVDLGVVPVVLSALAILSSGACALTLFCYRRASIRRAMQIEPMELPPWPKYTVGERGRGATYEAEDDTTASDAGLDAWRRPRRSRVDPEQGDLDDNAPCARDVDANAAADALMHVPRGPHSTLAVAKRDRMSTSHPHEDVSGEEPVDPSVGDELSKEVLEAVVERVAVARRRAERLRMLKEHAQTSGADIRFNAARSIQAYLRGRMARHIVVGKRRAQQAAAHIQAHTRGLLARRSVATIRQEQHQAARHIQACMRGFRTRCRAASERNDANSNKWAAHS
jgi:hypothetical protein